MKYKNKKIYEHDHKLAKVICCLLNTLLLMLYLGTGSILVLLLVNVTYFFGVNSIAYLIEKILHHKHNHGGI